MSQITVGTPSGRAALRALKQPLYDTQESPANANAVPNLTFFMAPIGNALNVTGAAKTIADTNLSASGSVGVPNEFDLFGFNLTFTNVSGYFETGAGIELASFCADIVEVYEASVFRFFFGAQKQWLAIPLSRVPHGTFCATGPGGIPVDGEKIFPVSNGASAKCEFLHFLSNDSKTTIRSNEVFSSMIEWPLAAYGLSVAGTNSRLVNYLVGVFYTGL